MPHVLLIALKIPFIDIGLGLNRRHGPIAGQMRVTYYAPEKAAALVDRKLADLCDDPDDVYRRNVQISELNAMNASLAMLRYKQLRGFNFDENGAEQLLMNIATMKILLEDYE